MENIVKQLKITNKDLKEAEIEGLLYLITTQQNLDSNKLIQLSGLPKETLKAFKSSFGNYLEDSTEKLALNDEGRKLLGGLELHPYSWSILKLSDEDLVTKLTEIRTEHNLNPVREYDQWFATIESSIAKAKMLEAKGLVEGKNIALMGDDDLVSIVLVLMGAKFNKVTVFDIDKNLLQTIQTIANKLEESDPNLRGVSKRVFTKEYDARNDFEINDLETYDVALTDPPYTRTGVALFLNRCVQLVKSHKDFSGSYIFLNYGNSFKSPEKTQKVQEVIGEFNLVIEDKIDKFVRYHGAESIGSASSLYVLKTTPTTSSKTDYLESRIYTYEDTKEEKFPFVDHYVFKLNEVPAKVIESQIALQKAVGEFCKLHKLKVVKTDIERFKPAGFTVTVILSNSNLLVHTWPEYKAVHIDLITCSPIHNKEKMLQSLQNLFSTQKVELKKIE